MGLLCHGRNSFPFVPLSFGVSVPLLSDESSVVLCDSPSPPGSVHTAHCGAGCGAGGSSIPTDLESSLPETCLPLPPPSTPAPCVPSPRPVWIRSADVVSPAAEPLVLNSRVYIYLHVYFLRLSLIPAPPSRACLGGLSPCGIVSLISLDLGHHASPTHPPLLLGSSFCHTPRGLCD